MPAPDLKSVPGKKTIDRAGNRYSFTEHSLLKTTPTGETTVIATSEQVTEGSFQIETYAFTDVFIGRDDTVYAAETDVFRRSYAELILKMSPNGTRQLISVSINPAFFVYPHCEVTVDDQGTIYSIAPDYSVIKIGPDGAIVSLVGSSAFHPQTGRAGISNLSVDDEGRVFLFGHISRTAYLGPILLIPIGQVPTITFQPQSRTVVQGNDNSFISVRAEVREDAGPLSYQWFLEGMSLPGAIRDTINVTQPAFIPCL